MNYDHLNKVHEYWAKEIFPNLSHHMAVVSFDDYLKQISLMECCKWLRDMHSVKIIRMQFAVDPASFTKQYKKHCVAYACPAKPEDGIHRIIYQISSTLHLEAALWIWVENKQVQSYLSMFICFKEEKELTKFLTDLLPIQRTGDTEEHPMKGFAGMMQ